MTGEGPASIKGAGPFRRLDPGAGVSLWVLAAVLAAFVVQPAAAQGPADEKCGRYGRAWAEAVRQQGTEGLSPGFLAAHEAFLASGCRRRAVCPRSAAEVAMADLMTIAAVNGRLAGTFLPFRCQG